MPTLAILNPLAGRRAALRTWRRLREELPALRTWECVTTTHAGHATELARGAATSLGRFERVVAIGGDGTVGEVATGLAHSGVPVAIIPAGTANDVAHNLRIPDHPLAAARLAASGAARPIDLGVVRARHTTRHFVNVAGLGFDAEAAWRVNQLPRLVGGTLPYLTGVLQTLWRYTSPRVRLRLDGHAFDARVFMVAVGNCASYAGGMRIVPAARPDDGVLDVCLVHALSRLQVLRMLPRLYSGGHVAHPSVTLFRCRTLEVEVLSGISARVPARVLCHADGEIVGGLPARFAIQPGALRCVTGPAPGSTS